MKKIIIGILIAVIAIAGIKAALSFQQKQTDQTAQSNNARVIRIGYQASSSLTVLEKTQKILENELAKDNVKVEYRLFLAGPPMNEALASGQIDIANMGPLPAISAKGNGINVKAIGRSYSDDYYYSLLIRPDSDISSLADLKGKKIGVQLGSGAYVFFLFLLDQNHLSLDDFNVVNMTTSDQKSALQNNNVDAVVTWQPFVADIELDNAGKTLINSKGVIKTAGVYLMRTEFGEKNPDLVKKFLKAHEDTAAYLKDHPDESLKAMAEDSKIPELPLQKSLQTIDWDINFTQDDLNTFTKIKDLMKNQGNIKKDFDINDFIDKSFIN
ncbi:ABC transporter substrate-binding protein [Pectinatus cerevisiiphilus]|uniref:Putative aliphatic sulfonates-binding protein n=1 Tax=Pectinatus cerevisiiphilus TaxID=86956 RepID=A0A4R3KAS0_9FIRM|nr:aliphatic sulfonate ABC transporter substrate-binding protein [Pectinatus cerevisiiphilus]TCS80098.1 sulfonate transport system substrate-binding protein [Pectinatus cerevisiiphilus]